MQKYFTISSTLLLLLLLLFSFLSFTASLETCVFQLGGMEYDLRPLNHPEGYTASKDTWGYLVNLCANISPKPKSKCTGDSRAFQIGLQLDLCYRMSGSGSTGLRAEKSSNANGGIVLVSDPVIDDSYTRTTRIDLRCDPTMIVTPLLKFEGETPGVRSGVYQFSMQTAHACPKKKGSTGRKCALGCWYGVGGLILTLAGVALALYFVIGFILCKFVWHKSGIKVIPNVHIWIEMGLLIKDGVMLIVDLVMKIAKKGDKYQPVE